MKKLFAFFALVAMISSVSCQKANTGKKGGKDKTEEETAVNITIDGKFDDWAAIADKAISAKTNPESQWDAVSEIRVYANADFVYYYVKFNKEALNEQFSNNEELPIRLCINTDGEFTSGYENYFLESYDFIIEGPLGNGEGGFGQYDGTLHQRINGSWEKLLDPNSNLVAGQGAGNEYEILLAREVFNNAIKGATQVNQPIGDIFYTGIRFYCDGWAEWSNMPNAAISEDNENGWGHLLEIKTDK